MASNGTFAQQAIHHVVSVRTMDVAGTNRALLPLLLAIVMIIGVYSSFWTRRSNLKHIPALSPKVSSEYRYKAKELLQRGYEQFNKAGKAFRVQTIDGPMVVLNAKQSEEVGAMPDHFADNMRPFERTMLKSYTGYTVSDDVVYRMIKTQLTTRLPEFGDAIADQIDRCLVKDFPQSEDWTAVQIYDNLLRTVAAVSTRVFVGEELAANEEWLSLTIDYTVQIMTAATIFKHIPSILLPLVYRFIPAYRSVQKNRKAAVRLIKPIVQTRREAMDKSDYDGGSDNFLQWTLNERAKKQLHDKEYELLANIQLELALAAIHTTTMSLANILFDLIAYPEYIQILREEVKDQVANNGGSFGGQLSKNLPKLDSFMKESQRMNPPALNTPARDILQDVTLSDGTFLPKDTFTAANSYHISRDPAILGSDSDADAFDGLRFYKLRGKLTRQGLSEREVAGKHQFVSTSNSHLAFGYGKHACPGRFFASSELKLIVAKFLLRFDLKMPPGETGRYENDSFEQFNYPNTDKMIMLKRI